MGNKIIAFCCENSSVMAVENIEDNNSIIDAVEIVRLPCSGKIEIGLVLKCLENGSPGVLVLACPKDNCKYISGNRRAEKRIDIIKKSLSNAGINKERVHIDFLSSVDSHKFIDTVKEMTERLTLEAGRKQASCSPVSRTAGAGTEERSQQPKAGRKQASCSPMQPKE